MKPQVLIYRSDLLPASETFIAAQAQALRRYEAVFAGLRRVEGSLPLPSAQVLASGAGLLGRVVYQETGFAPGFVAAVRARGARLLHAHFALDAAEVLPLQRALRLPLVVTLHGYDVMRSDAAHRETRRGRLYLARREELWARASAFVCVSNAIRQRALSRGFPGSKLQVLPIGVDTAALAFAERPASPESVLFVGRLVAKKGCAVLVRAMARLQREMPQMRLLIAGDGPERAALERLARQLTQGTRFLGGQSSEQVRALMHEAACLGAPSLTAADGDAEGLPTVLCEALALGLPVASSRHSGIPELIRHREHGLLSEEGDEAALARHLLELSGDRECAAGLSRRGRARVEQSFDLARQTLVLEQLYDEVVEGRNPARRGVVVSLAAVGDAGDVSTAPAAWETLLMPDRRLMEKRSGRALMERSFNPRAGHSGLMLQRLESLAQVSNVRPGAPVFVGRLLDQRFVRAFSLRGKAAGLFENGGKGTEAAKKQIPDRQNPEEQSPDGQSNVPAGGRLRTQAAWLLSGSGAATMMQALYFLLMGRMLGSREYGAFVGVVALVNVLSQFSSLGMEMVLLRTVARDRGAFGVTWYRAILISGCGFVLLLAGAMVYGRLFLSPSLVQLLPWLAVSDALFGKVTQLGSRALQGAGLMRWSAKLLALTNAARAAAAAVLFGWAAHGGAHVSLLLWVRTSAGASCAVAVVSFALVTRKLGWPRRAAVTRLHLVEGLSFSFSSSAISVYNDIDKTLLVSHGMLLDAGIYGAAYRLVDVVSSPVVSLFGAASPRLFRQGAREGPAGAMQGARGLLGWVMLFGLAAAPLLALCAPAIPRLFGHSFAGSISALRWLCLLPLLRGLHYAWGTAITACASQWWRTAAQAGVALGNLGLNLWLIPRYGWHGAAVASLLSDGALALATFAILRLLVWRARAPAREQSAGGIAGGGALQCSE